MPDFEQKTKVCTKCKTEKSLSEDNFALAYRGNNLYRSWCRKCEALDARVRARARAEKAGTPRMPGRGPARKY